MITTITCLAYYSMATILDRILELPELPLLSSYSYFILVGILSLVVHLILQLCQRKNIPIYLHDFSCYKPPKSNRLPCAMYIENVTLQYDPDQVAFQAKILERSGFGEETCIPESLKRIPIKNSLSSGIEETSSVIYSIVSELLDKTNTNPKAIDLLICNNCTFSPTPSIASMLVSKFNMRSNIKSFNLSGMGCSAGIISVGLAKDLLMVHPNSLALIVSTEMISLNWYTGKDRSMLLTNCLFRTGGAALLMSSRNTDKAKAKYELKHLVRTNRARDDHSYGCVFQDVDSENILGVSISKNILHVAADALKTNIASLGPNVLPFSEQFLYVVSIIGQKLKMASKGRVYVPKFKRCIEHFCVHAGGRAVIEGIERNLKLNKEDLEASKMTLYRFGNTSSSSIWYEVSYLEAKGRMKCGDRIWQIALGSGFKCNSGVWKCLNVPGINVPNVWRDEIHRYPVEVPDIVKIT